MIKEFNNLEEIQKYYDKKTNTYVFKENDKYIGLIKINFDLNIKSNIDCRNINGKNITAYDIDACDIYACDIYAYDINARDIYAWSISADNIIYSSECFTYLNIKCKSIKSLEENAVHCVLGGEIE